MIYAIRRFGSRATLQEFPDRQTLVDSANKHYAKTGVETEPVSTERAEQWVRDGREHETGLFVNDDGIVQYVGPQS